MANYLSKDGLEHFWGKLKEKLALKVDKYIAYKQYTNDYMYNNSNNGNCTGYDREFATVVANDWSKPWFVKFIIKTDLFYNSTTHYPTFHEVLIGCDNVSGTTWLRNFNVIKSTSYRSAHYINVYRPQSAVKAQDAPFRLNFRAGDCSSKTAHPRSYDIYLVEAVNCTCTLNEELDNQSFQKWYYNDHSTNAYYWSAKSGGTFYGTNFDICSNGLQETGDSDTYAYTLCHYYNYATVGTNGIKRYTILMQDKDGNYQSIVNEDNAYTVLTKTANTSQFRLNMPMFYYNSSTARSSGSRVAAAELRSLHLNADMRYSLNILADSTHKLTAYAKLFLVGTLDDEGYFKLDTEKWWAEGEPTEDDGKIYIYLGMVYGSDTYPYRCSVELEYASNCYWYKNGAFRHYPETGEVYNADYNDLDNKPTIPTKVSELTNDSEFTTATGHNHDTNYVKKSGDTLTGALTSTTTDVAFAHQHKTSSKKIGFGVGSGGANRGIYDYDRNQWALYIDNNTATPMVPTPATNDNSTKIATTSWVNTKLSDIVHISGAETITGNKTFTGYTTLGGQTTIKDVNKVIMDRSYTSNIIPNYQTATAPPWANNLWHDHLVLLREHTLVSKQFTSDGETWEDSTVDITPLFLGKEKNTITLLRSTDVAYRFTLKAAQMFHSSNIYWFEIAFGWSNPFSPVNVLIEWSRGIDSTGTHTTDESAMTWETLNTSNINASTLSAYFPAQGIYEQDATKRNYHLRFTFTKLDATNSGTLPLVYIKGWTNRKGSQGLGIENQYPFDWDINANMLPIKNNENDLGSSTKKWNTVYATTFNGKATSSSSADSVAWNNVTGKPSFFDGNYNNLTNKPTIPTVPTNVSSFTNDSGYLTSASSLDASKLTGSVPVECYQNTQYNFNSAYHPTANKAATMLDINNAVSGKQDKLTAGNNITIVDNVISSTASGGTSYDDTELRGLIANKADASSLSNVATSGSYNDLSDKPTIPSAYTLPIASADTLGGVKVGENLSIDENGVLSATGGGGGSSSSAIKLTCATCSTATSTKAKVATLAGFTLSTNATIAIWFANNNGHVSPTLNVNSTGAKALYVGTDEDKTFSTGLYIARYDGSAWRLSG